MSERLFMTVLIYVAPGERETFAEYERRAMPVMAEHGGRAECMMRPTAVAGDLALPDEVHVLSFETEDGFERYRADPRVVALAPLRERAIARAIFMRGPPVPPY